MNKKDLSGYMNPHLQDTKRIFSREDIKNMSQKEFSRNEKAIDYQI